MPNVLIMCLYALSASAENFSSANSLAISALISTSRSILLPYTDKIINNPTITRAFNLASTLSNNAMYIISTDLSYMRNPFNINAETTNARAVSSIFSFSIKAINSRLSSPFNRPVNHTLLNTSIKA